MGLYNSRVLVKSLILFLIIFRKSLSEFRNGKKFMIQVGFYQDKWLSLQLGLFQLLQGSLESATNTTNTTNKNTHTMHFLHVATEHVTGTTLVGGFINLFCLHTWETHLQN